MLLLSKQIISVNGRFNFVQQFRIRVSLILVHLHVFCLHIHKILTFGHNLIWVLQLLNMELIAQEDLSMLNKIFRRIKEKFRDRKNRLSFAMFIELIPNNIKEVSSISIHNLHHRRRQLTQQIMTFDRSFVLISTLFENLLKSWIQSLLEFVRDAAWEFLYFCRLGLTGDELLLVPVSLLPSYFGSKHWLKWNVEVPFQRLFYGDGFYHRCKLETLNVQIL